MKILWCLLAMLISTNAMAAEWKPVIAPNGTDQYFYDNSKLLIKDDEITYWKKVVFRVPQAFKGREASSGVLREQLDCAEHTAKRLSYLYYSGTGEIIDYVPNEDTEAAPIIPDSVGDTFEHVLCPMVWRKQEEDRIKAEQKAAQTELEAAAKEAKKAESADQAVLPGNGDEQKKSAVISRPADKNQAIKPPVAPLPKQEKPKAGSLPSPQINEQLF